MTIKKFHSSTDIGIVYAQNLIYCKFADTKKLTILSTLFDPQQTRKFCEPCKFI